MYASAGTKRYDESDHSQLEAYIPILSECKYTIVSYLDDFV